MDHLHTRKLDAFLPYERWNLVIEMSGEVLYSESFNSETDAQQGARDLWFQMSGETLTYRGAVKKLDEAGATVTIWI